MTTRRAFRCSGVTQYGGDSAQSTTALAALASVALSGSVEAAELDTTLKALPMHGISFDIGSKHAISYFLIKDGDCDLTVWLTDISNDARGRSGCTWTHAEFALRQEGPCSLASAAGAAGGVRLRVRMPSQ